VPFLPARKYPSCFFTALCENIFPETIRHFYFFHLRRGSKKSSFICASEDMEQLVSCGVHAFGRFIISFTHADAKSKRAKKWC